MMPEIPVSRACLDGLNLEDPVTGQHYADMLDAKIQAEGTESVLTFIVEPIGGASTLLLITA